MTLPTSSTRSPRPASVASYQSSSPRLPSPLNPSLNSFSPFFPSGHTPRNSSLGELSDAPSPLRERLDSGLASSPRSSPVVSQSRAPGTSRSPEQSPVTGPMPLQPHSTYARHPSPTGSPFAQGIAFPPSSPLAGPSEVTLPHATRPLSPSDSPRPCPPLSAHGPHSQLPTRLLVDHTHSHFLPQQSSPTQIMPSSSRFPRTQSLFQQSFGNQYTAQVASPSADNPRPGRVSLGTDSPPHLSTRGSPVRTARAFTQDASTVVKGNSTPVNEAPVRWWGGQTGWADDWDDALQQPHNDPYTTPSSGLGEFNVACAEHTCGNAFTFREPFGRAGGGPGAFLDEEIRASFDANRLSPGLAHASTRVNVGYETEGDPASRALSIPLPPGVAASRRDGGGYREVDVRVGPPPAEGVLVMQANSHNLARRHSCHLYGHASGFMHDGTMSAQDHGQNVHEQEHVSGRSRRFSNASTCSSASYISCRSGPSRSQSQSLLMSSSQLYSNTLPSLQAIGIGIEESERRQRCSRTLWGRGRSGSNLKRQSKDLGHSTSGRSEDLGEGSQSSQVIQNGEHGEYGQEGERVGNGSAIVYQKTGSKHHATHVSEKDTAKHVNFFARVGTKHLDEPARRAEEWVSIAIMSIFPPETVKSLSPTGIGESLIRTAESVCFAGHEIAPVFKDLLTISANLLACAPFPGLEAAAKALLVVWDACQKVDTNRLSCLRLVERCATLLCSVLCDIKETGMQSALDEPVQRLCGALSQIQTFLDSQLHRPFLKRYLRREEISRELQACNDAITDAASRFGMSVQIRTYKQVWLAANDSERFRQEARALLSLDHQIIQSRLALTHQQAKTLREEVVATKLSSGSVLVATEHNGVNAPMGVGDGSIDDANSDYLMPPPAYGPPMQPQATIASAATETPITQRAYGHETSISPAASEENSFDVADAAMSAPTPTQAMFIVEETKTKTITSKTGTMGTHSIPPEVIHALKDVHQAQDTVDAAEDEVALQQSLVGALGVQNDIEVVRHLQVGRGEIPEAAETLRRMLDVRRMGVDGGEPTALGRGEDGEGMKNTELDRRFMQTGIEALMRLASAVEENAGLGKAARAACASVLPSWTITRYEVVRTRKIGMGYLSDVYLGHWRKLDVVVKVLAHSVSREAFMRHVELWNGLDHPNVLPLYGASSTVGERPWFIVSKFCSGDNLVSSLKRARLAGEVIVGDKATVRLDLLRFMYEIAEGMAYLHGHGVLHGELTAANVLIDENGQCVLSDFGQCEIRFEAHQPCRELHHIQWRAPEMLMGDHRPTNAADVYAFAICCVEILGMGDLPWATLDDRAIRELVMDEDERPAIPVSAEYEDASNAIASLVQSCWVREARQRPSFSSITVSLEDIRTLHGHGSPKIGHSSTNTRSVAVALAESSPADEQYETASETMRTEVEDETIYRMTDGSLTSPVPTLRNGRSVLHVNASTHTEVVKVFTQATPAISENRDRDTPTPSPTNKLDVDTRNEENYRLIAGSNHTFHSSLTLPLWSPTRVELGAVGYLSKPKGEFITLFNAMDPLQSYDERLRQLPTLYGYGRFEVQRREEGKRSMAQRGLDAISGFLTFKTRGDRTNPERIARQFTFPLLQGTPSAHLCVEKTVHRYIDHLEAPSTWFKQHVGLIVEVCAPDHAIRREDLILVVGTLDAPDWAVFVSDEHADGRAQFSVFAAREKGEPWGMYTIEPAVKTGNTRSSRWVDVGQGTFASKVSCAPGGHDVVGDTVMLASLRPESVLGPMTM